MSISSRLLACGDGFRASDIVCTATPRQRPAEERHDDVCIALVTGGSFQYRNAGGAAVMAPGAILLGNAGACFTCGHEHAAGDRCLSFHFSPELLDTVAAATPGARPAFDRPGLPPLPALAGLAAAAEAARDGGATPDFEDLALRLAGAVLGLLAGTPRSARRPSAREERAVTAALRMIEAHAHEAVTLAGLAAAASMSRYHFLRVFRDLVGLTPHQYVLRTRLQRAALALRRSDRPVTVVAGDAGFDDLSTFNRRFRRVIGCSPSAYRARHAGTLRTGGAGPGGPPGTGLPVAG